MFDESHSTLFDMDVLNAVAQSYQRKLYCAGELWKEKSLQNLTGPILPAWYHVASGKDLTSVNVLLTGSTFHRELPRWHHSILVNLCLISVKHMKHRISSISTAKGERGETGTETAGFYYCTTFSSSPTTSHCRFGGVKAQSTCVP